MDREDKSGIKILMFPWLAHGHISPFLELGKSLSKRSTFNIYLCSTPVNLNSIKPKLSQQQYSSIKPINLHLPCLPPHHQTTNGLPSNLMTTLKKALDMAEPAFIDIIKSIKPDIIIYDFLQPWLPILAKSFRIPSLLFLTPGAASTSFFTHLRKNPSSEYPFRSLYIRDYELSKIASTFDAISNGIKDSERFDKCIEGSSDIVLIKTFRGIEGKYIDHVSMMYGKKIVPVGPLIQENIIRVSNDDDDDENIIKWLDKRGEKSSVYVSFGSEFFLSKDEIIEMAYGLEMSGVEFIWVLRFAIGEEVKIEEALPLGFLDRVGERGMVVDGWAPQGRILSHESVGGFVSHCGWGSVVESMWFGVPIVAVPMQLDQPINARLVVEVGVGVEVVRGGDGRLKREEISPVIRRVVAGKDGEGLRNKAKELSCEMRDTYGEEIDGVVEELLQIHHKNKC